MRQKKSLVAFAEEIGIGKTTLCDIEKGCSSSLDTVEMISRRLNLPAIALLSEGEAEEAMPLSLHLLRNMEWFCALPVQTQQEIVQRMNALAEILLQSGYPEE
jgi:transcriptional regulator with XRE-family HTH domain